MSLYSEFWIPSNDGKNELFVRRWLPDGREPKGIMLIAHGMSEHSGRYDEFACALADSGFAVYADDHLGHGKTAEKSGELGYFAPKDGWGLIVSDVESLRRLAKKEYPALPATLFGHSMGSFMARTHMLKYPGAFDFYIVSGTGQNPSLSIRLGKLLAKREIAAHGEKYRSKKLDALCFGAFNKPFARESDSRFNWLTHERDRVRKYDDDPYCGFVFTASAFADLFDGLSYISARENLKRLPKGTRVLLISGAEDPVGGRGKGVARAAAMLKKAGAEVAVKLWPGFRHELLNESGRAEVTEFIKKSAPTA